MPSISVHPPAAERAGHNGISSPLPEVLQTPSGLAMIEVQGSVLAENVEAGVALELGNLVFPLADDDDENGDWDGKRVFLFVGKHQRMAGEVKKLIKPVAVVRRRPVTANANVNANANASIAGSEEVEIAEIIYHKILFAHRPEPVGGEQQETSED